ncbi:MAG: ImmA/IrrE family metallo-endopeptidase [Betaproteobacteria bacterium AqS2]|uniref:ImmA/IrrE family metallo-endopeptidase n=1 Tax=Candidatus Amphirhobacter heronislandensis TaxID=1732024 RepID=A0A930UDC9_9GAMM|nr:ImmA/IrrE family metallo-endopeptidase [Betaproteobacteria bacterium AqS2]
MEKRSINPKRLQWCLDHYELSLKELAEDAHIELSTLERAATGEEALSYRELRRLAESCELESLFFTSNGELNGKYATPQLRGAKACLPPHSVDMLKLIMRVERRRDDYEGVLEGLGWQEMLQVEGLPRFSDNSDFASNAAKVRQWLGIKGGEGFDDLRRLVEDRNIMVFLSQHYEGRWKVPEEEKVSKFKGFTLDHASLPVLFVTRHQETEEQAFAMMHGLAHLIMHKGSKVENAETLSFFPKEASKEEEEANMLANCILLPDSAVAGVQAQDFDSLKPEEIKDRLRPICAKHCVSAAAVLARLHRAGKVSAAACQRYEEWTAKQSIEPKPCEHIEEWLHVFGHRYVRTIISAANCRVITGHKAMVYMEADFDTYIELKGWAR